MKIILFTTSDMRGTRRSDLIRLLASTAEGQPRTIVHYLMLQNSTEADCLDLEAQAPAWVRINSIPSRLSLSAARNVMLEKAVADGVLTNDAIVTFPDDDCWYPPLFLERMQALFQNRPLLDVLVTRCDSDPDREAFAAADSRPACVPDIVRKSSSNSMFIRGHLVRELRQFDETLGLGTPVGGGEDTEFVLRAYLQGRESAFIDRALVGHPSPTPDSAAKYYQGAMLVLARHALHDGGVSREFARKIAVGGYFLARGKLAPTRYLKSLGEAGRVIRQEASRNGTIRQSTPGSSAAEKHVLESDEISVLYCVDGAYLNQACVSLASLLANNPGTPLAITIAMLERVDAAALRAFSRVIDPYPLCRIKFRDIDLNTFTGMPTSQRFSASVYARIVLSRFMETTHKRVLYLDADTIVQDSVLPLWKHDLQGKAIAAAPDRFRLDMGEIGFDADEPYFNSGVILFDMKAWRERNCEARVLGIIEQQGHRLPWMDQDALNIALRGDVAFVDCAWNFQPRCADVPASFLGLKENEYRAARMRPRIIHYTTSLKPWNAAHKIHYSDQFFKMVELAGLEPIFARSKAHSFKQRSEKFRTWMRWRFPRLFRLVRTALRPQAAAMMYRSR